MSRKYRNRPTRDYTVLRNAALRNPALSLKAKGALALMLTFPDDWEYHLDHLEAMSRDGRDALRSAIRELEAHGYIKRFQRRRPDGTLGDAEYHVTDDVPTVDGKTVAGQSVAGKTVAGKPAATKTDLTKTDSTKTEKTWRAPAKPFDPLKVDLPPFVSQDAWADFVQHRRDLGKRLTPRAVDLIIADLKKTPGDADEMLRTSVKRGWTGVFPLDGNRKTARAASPILDQYTERGL